MSYSAPDFSGDRGKNNLAKNNERELVPFFLQDQAGNQVVNDNLYVASELGKGQPIGSGRKAPNPQANIAAAKANKATAVRPFAVGHKQIVPPAPAAKAPAKAAKQPTQPPPGKWAGGAFLNSPPPSSLPMPKFMGGAAPSLILQDPAIVSSSSSASAHGWGKHATPQSARKGSRVLAKFTDGLWYEATVLSRRGDDLDVVFDGYENEGTYPVPASDVTLLTDDTNVQVDQGEEHCDQRMHTYKDAAYAQPQHHGISVYPHAAHRDGFLEQPPAPALCPNPVDQLHQRRLLPHGISHSTSLEDLESKLLSTDLDNKMLSTDLETKLMSADVSNAAVQPVQHTMQISFPPPSSRMSSQPLPAALAAIVAAGQERSSQSTPSKAFNIAPFPYSVGTTSESTASIPRPTIAAPATRTSAPLMFAPQHNVTATPSPSRTPLHTAATATPPPLTSSIPSNSVAATASFPLSLQQPSPAQVTPPRVPTVEGGDADKWDSPVGHAKLPVRRPASSLLASAMAKT